jgi:hypothetical protein
VNWERGYLIFFFWNKNLSECYVHWPECYLNENLSECFLHLPECAPIPECYLSECFLKWKGMWHQYESNTIVWIPPVWNLSILVWICTWSHEYIYTTPSAAMFNLVTIPNGYIAHMTHLIITHAGKEYIMYSRLINFVRNIFLLLSSVCWSACNIYVGVLCKFIQWLDSDQQHQPRWSSSSTAALVTHTYAQKHKRSSITTIQTTHQQKFSELLKLQES